jgi:lipoate-protein ligase A
MSSEVSRRSGINISGVRGNHRFFHSARNDKIKETTQSLFATLTVYHDETPRSAAMNMATDEVLLEYATSPAIRFYRWRSPALSFGYFGRFADVASHQGERDLVRRWTGGGIVFHGEDLTYSIVIPASDAVFPESSRAIYERIHLALCQVFLADGKPAELLAVAAAYDRRKSTSHELKVTPQGAEERRFLQSAVIDRRYNDCFANPVRADVMIDGRKVAGAAQRRTRRGLLQQGTIQGVNLANDLAERFAEALSTSWAEREVDDAILNGAGALARQKYGAQKWLRKR